MSPVHHRQKKNRRTRERLLSATLRYRVFLWDSREEEAALEGFGFVSDFSEAGLGAYIGRRIPPGTNVRIAFESLAGVTYRGVVMWAKRYTLSQGFIGHAALSYQVGVKYLFGSEAERQRYLAFLQEARSKVLMLEPGMKF